MVCQKWVGRFPLTNIAQKTETNLCVAWKVALVTCYEKSKVRGKGVARK